MSKVSLRQVGMKKVDWKKVDWRQSDNTLDYPSGAILHYDADIDAFSELTGGPHTFNHAVLSPQYQRNADGSYTDVGAKPAVDVYDGEKWLRSCGAVTNLLTNSANLTGMVIVPSDGLVSELDADISPDGHPTARRLQTTTVLGRHRLFAPLTGVIGNNYTLSVWVKAGTATWVQLVIYSGDGAHHFANFDLKNAVVGFAINYKNSIDVDKNGWCLCTITGEALGSECNIQLNVLESNQNTIVPSYLGTGKDLFVWGAQLTASAYPRPYVPTLGTSVTQPASNATTTNGMWFTLPDGSPMWKALTGQPLTLATRIRMGVGSGDVVGSLNLLSAQTAVAGGLGPQYYADSGVVVKAFDGTASVFLGYAFARNAIIRRVTQVNTAGTQYRVGYMVEGTHTTIQWSAWAAFDGSFGPSTLYRLMLGYNNAYPMWFSRITAWKEQVSDDRILEALNG